MTAADTSTDLIKQPLRIGVSACFFHADPERPIFKGKTLLYLEQSMAHYIMSQGAIPVLIPTQAGVDYPSLVSEIDGLLLQGGSDVSPKSYGEDALRPEWSGDYVRDQYEIALIRECIRQEKPILGICRGIQILNVALGGSLYQDIDEQLPHAHVHRDWHQYDDLEHNIAFEHDTRLSDMYKGDREGRIVSIHHQALKAIAEDLVVEAHSTDDEIVEAVRHRDDNTFVYGVQWHPEFHAADGLMDNQPIMIEFLNAARKAQKARQHA